MSKLIMISLFCLAAILIMSGVYIKTKSTLLTNGKNSKIYNNFWALLTKFSGFTLLAYLVYTCPAQNIIFYLCFFIATYFVSFLLYLLARKASLR